jgi:SSS family solute:Na+ symporter
MHIIDITIFITYLVFMLGVGFYFLKKNKSKEDYFVGGRNMKSSHIGLSVVATDVGGGFSIGLGGLGFAMGISGSWMLFTGLLGAWFSAVWLIPKVYPIGKKENLLTFPQVLKNKYGLRVALIAGIISLIGYIGFTSSQILAGAKLASATFPEITIFQAVLIMGIIAVVYTVIGGIKAVIYTDTIQWIILMAGLLFIGIPVSFFAIGGWDAIQSVLGPEFLSLTNVTWVQIVNWFITIVPIWFIGMTLYQRIFSCRDQETAVKAWKIAGFFEWPIMAFLGVLLGLFARVGFEQGMFTELGYAPGSEMDPELGLPMLLSQVLPIGLMGLMMSAYFSAIMSTADSCLMAASGNLSTDILPHFNIKKDDSIRFSQWITFLIGAFAVVLATYMQDVLDLMLNSYAFMVSGLLVPVLAMLWLKQPKANAAIAAMLIGGSTTITLMNLPIALPLGLDANLFGLSASALAFIIVQQTSSKVNISHG